MHIGIYWKINAVPTNKRQTTDLHLFFPYKFKKNTKTKKNLPSFAFDYTMKDGNHRQWNEIIRRRWANNKVVDEKVFRTDNHQTVVRSENIERLHTIHTYVDKAVPVEIIVERVVPVETIVERIVEFEVIVEKIVPVEVIVERII